jgi:hypothetical protein
VTATHAFAAGSATTYGIDLTTHTKVWSHPKAGPLAMSGKGLLVIAGGLDLTAVRVGKPEVAFRRGEANGDGRLNITDAIAILKYIGGLGYYYQAIRDCQDRADVDDDGRITITDGVVLLRHLFLAQGPIAMPYPDCGEDPTPDGLVCEPAAACE